MKVNVCIVKGQSVKLCGGIRAQREAVNLKKKGLRGEIGADVRW